VKECVVVGKKYGEKDWLPKILLALEQKRLGTMVGECGCDEREVRIR